MYRLLKLELSCLRGYLPNDLKCLSCYEYPQ